MPLDRLVGTERSDLPPNMTAMAVESWDDDIDFATDGPLFATSVSTLQTSLSSRLSVRSESMTGDDDWNVVLPPGADDAAAIQRASERAGIPIPSNVPSSALLGGTIKKLGKKKSRAKITEDDWGQDLDLDVEGAGLTLKKQVPQPATPSGQWQAEEGEDDFDEWAEGSLGIRFAGTRRNRSTSAQSAMSPSMGSATADSEVEDDMKGLELPQGPLDFEAILKKRRAADAELSDLSQQEPTLEQPQASNLHKKSKLLGDEHDEGFLDGLDFGGDAMLDVKKRTVNKNLKVRPSACELRTTTRPATTLNFHDKPTDKPTHVRSHIPRPVSGTTKPASRLEPVLETGASQSNTRERRLPTTTGLQLLRSKRSMPVLRGNQAQQAPALKPTGPLLPAGGSNHVSIPALQQRALPHHLRRGSDPHSRPLSPPARSHSRLSTAFVPDTPSRASRRSDLAPAALAREAAAKRTVTKPARRRNFGDGSELEIFDDLPTSVTKESKFVKQPSAYRGPGSKLHTLRHAASKSDVRDPVKSVPSRMMTPAPPPMTPRSPTKHFEPQSYTPSYLRDTAASRIARESRLGGERPRSQGPLMPVNTNWKAQIAARSPHSSPSAARNRPIVKPQLIKAIGAHVAKTEKGMTYNPLTLRWEGNENTLSHFDLPPPSPPTPTTTRNNPTADLSAKPASPPRPALIAPMSTTPHIQVVGGMVFDPRAMKWLKFKPAPDPHPGSPAPTHHTDATDDDADDPFAGLPDLADENHHDGGGAGASEPKSDLREEFDLGPGFIRRQRDEEAVWRERCAGWFPLLGAEARGEAGGGRARGGEIRGIARRGAQALR